MKSKAFVPITIALLTACSGISTSTEYDPGFDFVPSSTYDWID